MALADLIARLEADAATRVTAVRAQAAAEVRALEDEATRVAAEESAARLEARRVALERELQREFAQTRQRFRAEALTAQRALVARIFERAQALVPEVGRSEAYLASVGAHALEALSFLEGLRPVVRCSPEVAAALLPLVQGRKDVLVRAEPGAAPGVLVEAADGSVQVDNTLAARLTRLEPQLTIDFLRELGGAS